MNTSIDHVRPAGLGDKEQDGILIEILGESRPFSQYGNSISYYIRVADQRYLIDCGAPIFEFLPRNEIEALDGLLATHSHEDHKRWFTDLALYMNYLTEGDKRLNLITTNTIHEEFMKNSRGALERTLSPDSKQIIEVPYEQFVNPIPFGPVPKFRIVYDRENSSGEPFQVLDDEGNSIPPDRAKIVIKEPEQANRPRLLLRDPDTSKWVEPTQFYSFSSSFFYEQEEPNIIQKQLGNGEHLRISPVKDPVWHGPPTIGIEIETASERVVFSSDTVYDPELWRSLATEEQDMQFKQVTRDEFESSQILYGDINQFIQLSWSEERLERALSYYRDAVVVHDCGPEQDPVHSGYSNVKDIECDELILTHCPDQFVSEFPIALTGKLFQIVDNDLFELTASGTFPLTADVYFRDNDATYAGFQSADGSFTLVEHEHSLQIIERNQDHPGEKRMHLTLVRDINGQYFPHLEQSNVRYRRRPDDQIERVEFHEDGSSATIVTDHRTPDGGISNLL